LKEEKDRSNGGLKQWRIEVMEEWRRGGDGGDGGVR